MTQVKQLRHRVDNGEVPLRTLVETATTKAPIPRSGPSSSHPHHLLHRTHPPHLSPHSPPPAPAPSSRLTARVRGPRAASSCRQPRTHPGPTNSRRCPGSCGARVRARGSVDRGSRASSRVGGRVRGPRAANSYRQPRTHPGPANSVRSDAPETPAAGTGSGASSAPGRPVRGWVRRFAGLGARTRVGSRELVREPRRRDGSRELGSGATNSGREPRARVGSRELGDGQPGG